MYQIIKKVGRAGGPNKRLKQQEEWDTVYGIGRWEIVYVFNDKTYTRESALDVFYNRSYFEFLKNNPAITNGLCALASDIYNPHSNHTGGVDLQCPAVMIALLKLNKSFNGNQSVAIGTWGTKQGKKYPPISQKLSPYKVPLWCNQAINVEEFWQNYKYLAIKKTV